MLLGLHTFNLVTDVADTLVLTAVVFKEPVKGKRFVDVAENYRRLVRLWQQRAG